MRPVTMFRAVLAAAVCLRCAGWVSAQAVVEGTVYSNAAGPGQIWVWASTSGAWGEPCVVAGTPSARGYMVTPPVAYQLPVPFNSNVWVMACKDNNPPYFPPQIGMDPTQGDPKSIHSLTPFFVASGPVTGRDITISESSAPMNPVLLLNMDGFDFEAASLVGWQLSDLRYTSDFGQNMLEVMYGGGWGIHDNGDVPLMTVAGFPNTRSDPTAVQPVPGHVYTFLTDQGKTVRMKVLRVGTTPPDVEFVFDHDYTAPPVQPGDVEGNVVYAGTRTGVMFAFAGSDPQFRTQPEHHTEVMDDYFHLRDLNPAVTWYVAVVLFTRGTMDLTKYDPWGIHGTTTSPTPVRVLSGQIINIPTITLVDGTDEVPNPFWREEPLCRSVCEYPDRYRVEFEVEADSSVTAVRVTGPGIGGQTTGTMSLGYADGKWSSWALGPQNAAPWWTGQPPALPLTYTFELVEPATTTYRIWQVTGFYESFATPMTPPHNAAVPNPSNLVFQWMPAAGAGRYGIEVRERYDYGGRFMWGYYDISPQQTSIRYNADQRGAPLEFGKIYEWNVRASSAGGDAESVSQTFYFVVSTGGVSIGQAKVSGEISYTGGVAGELQVMLGFGMPGPSWTPVRTLNLGPQSGVFNGRPYFIDNVAPGSDYYVVAMIDDNNPLTPPEQHPAGFYGPFAVSGAMEHRNADITVYNRTGATGDNTITGSVSCGAGMIGSPRILVEAGIGAGNGDLYEVRGMFTRYGPGSFTITGLPDGTPYYVRAYADLNGDAVRNPSEPWGFAGPFALAGSTVVGTAVPLNDPTVAATTITVTLRALVRDAAGQPLSGAAVYLVDTGGYNDYQPINDVIIATRTTLSSPATYYDANLGITLQYNCQFSSVTLKANEGPNEYGYLLQASRQGFRTDTVYVSFDASWDGGLRHAGTLHLSPKPPVTIADLDVYPPAISPDFDGFDDIAKVGFTYIVGSSQTLWQNGASVRMVVDTNRNGMFDPVDERMFFYDSQGRRWQKKNISDFIDYNNPDYSRLIGPLSEEQYNALVSTSDVSVQEYVDGWSLQVTGGSATARVQLSWEGRDPAWNPVANGVYLMRIEVDDPTFDEKDGINAVTLTSVTVLTAGIRGRVSDQTTGLPVAGARVSAGGPSGGNQAYTRADGAFEVAGLRAGELYSVSIQRAGYVDWTQAGIQASVSTAVVVAAQLAAGVPISGMVTLPNPPQAGTVRDQWNNLMYDIWVQVRADNMSGPGSGWTDVRIPLPEAPGVSQAATGYVLYVPPGSKQRVSATARGYVATAAVLNVAVSSLTHHIGLIRAARLESSVQLSTDPAVIDELRVHSNGQGLNVNVYANTKDGSGGTGSWVYFSDQELMPGASRQFVLDALTPNTTYTLGVESGLLARREFTVVVGSGTVHLPPIALEMGAKLAGVIRVLDDVNDIVSRYSWWEGNQTPGFWVQIELTNRQDFTRSWSSVFISTANGWGADLSSAAFTVIGLQPGASYSMSLSGGVGALDIEPGESDRIVAVSSVASVTQAPAILMRRATGVVRGRIVNQTGKSVNLSAVKVVSVMMGGEGDGPQVWPVAPDGTFAIQGLRTGRMIMWGTEYSVPPLSNTADFFGTATGNAGTFFRDVYAVSRTTVTLGDIPLKPGSTLQVVLNGPAALIDTLYAQTTSFHALVAAGSVETEGPFGFMRVQPVFFREIAQELVSADAEDGMHPKDIAFTLDTSIERVSSTSIRYSMPGLEQGIYYVYPMVGALDIARYRTTDYARHEKLRLQTEGWTAFPLEQAVTMGLTEMRQVGFGLSAGVNVLGSVRRPPSALGTGETINVSVKDTFSGMQIASADLVFVATKPVTDAAFSFSGLPPGSYTLTVWSPGYKLVSQPLILGTQQSTVTVPVVVLAQGAAIVGRLMDAAGNAVRTGVKVECRALPYVEGSYRDTTMPGLAVSTGSATAGRFRFPNLPGGTYLVRVSPTADATVNCVVTVKSGITVPDSAVEVDLGVLQLQAGVDITGTVVLPDSTTVAGIKVVAWPQDVQLRSGMELTAYTDSTGRFTITGVNPGVRFWELRCNVREDDLTKVGDGRGAFGEYVLSNVDVTRSVTRTDITIRLQYATGVLAGRVVTENGAPLIVPVQLPGINVPDFPAALLLLQSPRDVVSGNPMAGIRSITGATGDFFIDGIVPGPYTLKVFARGFMTAVQDVLVSTGGITNIGVVTLQTGRRVSGTIRTDVGGKVTGREASLVVAANRDHSRFVIGFVNTNPLTQEVNDYEINGLEPGVTYYAVIVAENGDAVMVDPAPFWLAAGSDVVKNLVYLKPRPHFEIRNYRLPGLTKQRLQAFIAYERDRDLAHIMTVPFEEWGKYLLISRYMMDREEYLTAAPSTFTYYFVYGFVTEPVRAETVSDIVSTVAASGLLIPLELAATRKQLTLGYIAAGDDFGRGYFELLFSAANYYGVVGEDRYRFHLGEDARSEKVINPLMGGSAYLGDGDDSGLEVPPGSIDDPSAISSGTKIVVLKLEPETMRQAVAGGLARHLFSRRVPNTAYPGELMSAVYDMQLQLVSGPLASLAQNRTVTIQLALSSAAVPAEAAQYRLHTFNEQQNRWVPETGPQSIDWAARTMTAQVGHLTAFAVFKVAASTGVEPGPQPYDGPFAAYVYPNPARAAAGLRFRIALPQHAGQATLPVTVRIYTMAGKLVRTLNLGELATGMRHDVSWDAVNEGGARLASGVYLFHLKAGGVHSELKKFAIIH